MDGSKSRRLHSSHWLCVYSRMQSLKTTEWKRMSRSKGGAAQRLPWGSF